MGQDLASNLKLCEHYSGSCYNVQKRCLNNCMRKWKQLKDKNTNVKLDFMNTGKQHHLDNKVEVNAVVKYVLKI